MNKWNRKYTECIKCGTTNIKHKGYGLCRLCYGRSEHHKKSSNKWRASIKGKDSYKQYNQYLRLKALDYYSDSKMKCAHCGYKDIRALTLDHINNDGAKLRKTYNTTTFAWLRTKKYPAGYQVLCFNCNWIKEVERRSNGI